MNGLAINTKLAPYNDVKVRQALQAGINRQEIIDTVYTPDWKRRDVVHPEQRARGDRP